MIRSTWRRMAVLLSYTCCLLSILLATASGLLAATEGEPEHPGLEYLAGVLVPDDEILYLLPEHHDGVLSTLGAREAEPGWYQAKVTSFVLRASGVDVDQVSSLVLFQVVFVDGFGPDGTVGDGVRLFDPNRVEVQLYVDHTCVSKDDRVSWHLEGCEVDDHRNTSSRRYLGPWSTCQFWRGAYCMELRQPIEITFLYRDAHCNLLTGANVWSAMSCHVPPQ